MDKFIVTLKDFESGPGFTVTDSEDAKVHESISSKLVHVKIQH